MFNSVMHQIGITKPNTVALYQFDNSNGNDSSPNAYHLTLNGTVPFQSSSQQGRFAAGSFSDSNYFTTPTAFNTAWSNLNAWTIQFWIYTTDFSNSPTFMCRQDANTYVQLHATLGFRMSLNGNLVGFNYVPQNLVWTHVAYTYNGTNVKQWINGSNTQTTTMNGSWGTITTWFIGRYFQSISAGLSGGMIDQLRFSNVALTSFPTAD